MAIFDFRDASFRGPPDWQAASRWTKFAPVVVINLLILSIIEVILGTIHITSINAGRGAQLTFAQVIQPLLVPALSFFNTVPSLHLHVLARSNKPLMAMIFSSIMSIIYFASAIVFLPPCAGGFQDFSVDTTVNPGNGNDNSANDSNNAIVPIESSNYQQTECPVGTRKGIWSAMVALQFISALGYAIHFAMAWKVRQATRQRRQDEREGRVMVVVDEEAKARREEEARKRWTAIRDL